MIGSALAASAAILVMLQAAAPPSMPSPGTSSTPAPASSLQAAFDTATRAWEEGRCAEAVAGFDALATLPAARKGGLLRGAIAARRAQCLLRLDRADEAEPGLRAGADELARHPAPFTDEAREAYFALAKLEMRRFAYDDAIADARRALALAQGRDRVLPLMLLSSLTRFDADGAAIRYGEEAVTLMPASTNAEREQLATVQTVQARALMVAGRNKEANDLLKSALANNGGLSTRVSLSDIATRYDLAQAAMLLKRPDEAKLYLAYTGAGRQDTPFQRARSMDAPMCDVVPGMKPDAYAVVEFSIGEDGSVLRAEPVFAQGGRDVALAFARSVNDWSWAADDAKAIPPFYRALTRVELRCTRDPGRAETEAPLTQAVAAWLESRGVKTAGRDGADGREALARARAAVAGSDVAALGAALTLARSDVIPAPERMTAAAHAKTLAESLGAPQTVRTLAAIAAADVIPSGVLGRGDSNRVAQRQLADYRALLAQPPVAAEPVGADTLRLKIVGSRPAGMVGRPADAPALLAAVADDSALPAHHPLRVAALLQLADDAASRNDPAAAEALFRRTGLTEQQCSLIAPTPAMKHLGATSNLYPVDALRMGFGGWAKVEYDIAADGRTAQQRALVAYPPFVFGEAARQMIAATRYERSYRPENGMACAANQTAIRFSMPN